MELSTPSSAPGLLVAALYRFFPLAGREALRRDLLDLCLECDIKGTLLIAAEGINGTVAGSDAAIGALLSRLAALPGWDGAEVKFSRVASTPFERMKVRLKKEIVTLGIHGLDPVGGAGTHVDPADWNALIADPGTVVVDTRNVYETAIGRFAGALNPKTETFRAFPDWVEANRPMLEGKAVAMYCTGGIRCEKATAYMRSLGFERVYHLKGGILKYLEEVPAAESMWQGECFVFDERVAVGHGLVPGSAVLCRACGHPVTPAQRDGAAYREGVSCPNCVELYTEDDRARFAERQRQMERAGRAR